MLHRKIIFPGVLLAALFCGMCPRHANAEDKIVAIVNKDVITEKDVVDFTAFTRMQMSQAYGDADLEAQVDAIRAGLLDRLIEDKLMLQDARANNMNVDESRVKARLREIKSRYATTAEFQEDLLKHGLNQSDVERKMRDQMLMFMVVDRKVRDKIVIRPDEVTRYYQENKNSFLVPEERAVDIITAENKETADAAMHDLKRAVTLVDIQSRYPISVNSMLVHKNKELDADIEPHVFALEQGAISTPILINDKYYFFRVNTIKPARELSLAEVQTEINAILFEQKMKNSMKTWLDDLKANAYIKKF